MRKALILGILAFLLQSCGSSENKLPILGERAPIEKNKNGKIVTDTIYHTIPAFSFLNQDSTRISEADFNGKIYVTDFFFTSCTSICPIMHRNMLNVYNKFKGNQNVKFLSHSIDVKYDVPSRLKKYADKLGLSGNQWQFVYGSKDSIFNFAAGNYLVSVAEDSSDPQGLVHQGWFILVDTKKQIRGAYDGTQAAQVELLMKDINKLLKEEGLDEK